MNAIQKISQDLLRERGGTPFEPAGPVRTHAAAPRPEPRLRTESAPLRSPAASESVDRLARLAG